MKGPPVLTEFSASFVSRYPVTPPQQVMNAYAQEYLLYLQHNTDVYHILRASMLLQGPFVEADIKLFHKHFHLNDYRDGKGLYTPGRLVRYLRHYLSLLNRIFSTRFRTQN